MRNSFVSLGSNCQPVHHIRRLTSRPASFIFDWIRTPLRSVIPLIEARFEDIFDPNVLNWTWSADHWRVTDNQYGLVNTHHFKSRDDIHVEMVIRRLREIGQLFLERLEGPEPIIFVRRWHRVDADASPNALPDLHAYLTARKPACVFLFLQPHDTGEPIVNGNYIKCYNPPTLADWMGDATIYDRNFALADQIATTLYAGPDADEAEKPPDRSFSQRSARTVAAGRSGRSVRDASITDIASDAQILAAADTFIAGRPAGDVLHALYHRNVPAAQSGLDLLAALLPAAQIEALAQLERLSVANFSAVVILMAVLSRIRGNEAWIHFHLCKYLNLLAESGVPEAKLPAIIHALLALEGLKESTPNAKPLPLSVLARELVNLAPREAVRSGILAARYGLAQGLHLAAPALAALGLEKVATLPAMSQAVELGRELDLSPELVPRTTKLAAATGVRSVAIEPPGFIRFPQVQPSATHYAFARSGQEEDVPGISVHVIEDGTFSIDATRPGLEQHYVFDRNGDCVAEFANGIDPFVTEPVSRYDEPVAILDDLFSGSMNIRHFLLDRVTRMPLYDRVWSRPGKFFIVDDYPYYRDIFARMGLADRVIVAASKRVTIRAPEILFSSNIAADFRHPAHHGADWAIDYLRRALDVEERPARRGRKLLISRGDANGRAILNWQELLPVFHRNGFEVVQLAGLSTEEQIALFRDASQVVGVHGAGLTNILFAPQTCAVLEILPPLAATHAYWLLASKLGQRYTAMIAEDPELPRPDYATWRHNAAYIGRDVLVPVERLEAALAAL